ncbi:MAG: DUF1467 family protein [Pseudomonadota bacterium]
MNIAGVVVIFVIWWWVAFLALLPTGLDSRGEAGEEAVKGADPGAPSNPALRKKALRATIAAAALTLVTSLIIISGVIDFRE